MRSVVIAVVAAVLVMGLCLETSATVPRLVNYQGIVTDAGGLPITGPHNLAFRIYADSAQSSPVLWSEIHSGVPISQGLFNVVLGGTTSLPDSLFGNIPRWMGVSVDADGEMTPRMQLTSVPWAFRAALAESSATLPSHTHDDRYYTETELNSTGTINTPSNPVDWTELKSVPAGFADGTDDVGGGTDGWMISGNNEYSNVTGSVGIGTTTPAYNLKLHVVNPSDTANATAVYGEVSSTGAGTFHDGVWGLNRGIGTGAGVFGQALGGAGSVNGVTGSTNCPTGRGVQGGASSASGVNYGVSGYTASANGYAGYFQGQATGFSGYFLGGKNYFEGNVGIGTTTPSVKLDVAGTAKMTGFSLPTGAATSYVLTSDASGVGTWQAATGGGAGWTIINGGNDEYASVPGSVAIGTPTPNSLYKLYVENQSAADNAKAIFGVETSNTSTGRWLCGVGGETRCTNLNDLSYGVIGLATADSGKGVGVYGYSAASSGIGVFGSVAKPSAFAGYFLGGKNYFEGNVGIGTLTPAYMLDVIGDTHLSGNVRIGTTDAALTDRLRVDNPTASGNQRAIYGVVSSSGSNNSCYGVMGQTNSTGGDGAAVFGNVNASTGSAAGVLAASGSVSGYGLKALEYADHGTNYAIYGLTGNPEGYCGYFQGGKNYFGGNVGIGTAAPISLLHVKGTTDPLLFLDSPPGGSQSILALGTDGQKKWGWMVDGGGPNLALYHWPAPTGRYLVFDGTTANIYTETSGNVGIGTPSPSAKLHVVGNAFINGNVGVGAASSWSKLQVVTSADETALGAENNSSAYPTFICQNDASGGTALDCRGTAIVKVLQITGADVAEKFTVREDVEPGTVVAIDPERSGDLCLARGEYNRCVAGVISGAGDLAAGAILGNLPGMEKGLPVALSGRVWVKCDASKQPIEPGDLLTTSDRPGLAMKVGDYTRAQGAIIGKAMTALPGGEGLVLALVSLQ